MPDDRNYAPDFVSAETLAYRLDCSRSTIDVYVRLGLLPKPQTIGNLQRWDFSEIRAFIVAQNNGNERINPEDEFMKAVSNGANQKS